MAQDDDFIIGGRKTRKSVSQGSPRPSTSKGGSASQPIVKLGNLSGGSMSFTKRLAKDMAIAKRSSGRRTYAKPSKPRTGRFNARGRGRSALLQVSGRTVQGRTLTATTSAPPRCAAYFSAIIYKNPILKINGNF